MKKFPNYFFFLFLICLKCVGQSPVIVENQKLTIPNIGSTNYELKSKGELRVSSSELAVTGSVNLMSDSAWLILDGIVPSVAIASHLSYISVNGQPAVNKNNVRITNYLQGCVIMAHSPTFEALSLFKDAAYAGDVMTCFPYKYYKKTDLGSFDNTISSFKLKKGYMATFAQNENGTGYSKVYIAEKEDMEVPALPLGLNNLVSFVRVFPWRYTDKKGLGSVSEDFNRTVKPAALTKCGWFYHWGTNTNEDLTDIEFVSQRWNAKSLTDSRWKEITDINYASHLLGFNEPDADTQANMTLEEMILYWPKMLESGMRLGSPAPAGTLPLLYEFIDKCDELNYRVDFAVIHDYGESSIQQFLTKCETVHNRTGRPIWIKEFNWGGTWTNSAPTYPVIAKNIADVMKLYDAAGFVERYAIFNFDQVLNHQNKVQNRAIFVTPAIPLNYTFTLLGDAYRDNVAPMAFNVAKEINKTLKLVSPQNVKITNINGATNTLTWDENSGGIGTIFIERAYGSGSFSTIAQVSVDQTTYTDDVTATGFGKYNYRFSTRQSGMTTSKTVLVPFDVNPNTVFNVALKKQVVASNTRVNYPAENAVDGNIAATSGRWVTDPAILSPTNPVTFEINLGGTFAISQLKFYNGNGTAYNSPATSFAFQYLKDGNWIDVITETANTAASYSKSFQEVTADKVRLQLRATADGTGRFYEIEVYGRIASLGTNNFVKNKFDIYPNPASDIINISGETPLSSVQIFDLNAKLILTHKPSNSVNVTTLPAGIYFMKLNNQETIKFIKK